MTITAPPDEVVTRGGPIPFCPRGALSSAVLAWLTSTARPDLTVALDRALVDGEDVIEDDDIQLTLFALYASSYGSIPAFDAELEWEPALIGIRRRLEHAFERHLRRAVPTPPLR